MGERGQLGANLDYRPPQVSPLVERKDVVASIGENDSGIVIFDTSRWELNGDVFLHLGELGKGALRGYSAPSRLQCIPKCFRAKTDGQKLQLSG